MLKTEGISTKYENGIAPYANIAAELRRQLLQEQWSPHTKLPAERKLAQQLSVTQNTVHRALQMLENEGLVYSRHGRGRFIADREDKPRTGKIGILIPLMALTENPVMHRRLAGVENALLEHDYNYQINTVHSSRESAAAHGVESRNQWLNAVELNSVDGLIIMAGNPNLEALELLSRQTHVAFHGPRFTLPDVLTVRIDLLGGAFEGMRYLAELGHRRIAVVTARPEWDPTNEVLDGCRLAYSTVCEEWYPREFIYPTEGHTCEDGLNAGEAILELPPGQRPTAVLTASSELAEGVMKAVHKQSIVIPDELSLLYLGKPTGVDMLESVTNVEYDFTEIGRLLAEGLIHMIQHPRSKPETEIVHGRLNQLDSCGLKS